MVVKSQISQLNMGSITDGDSTESVVGIEAVGEEVTGSATLVGEDAGTPAAGLEIGEVGRAEVLAAWYRAARWRPRSFSAGPR